MTPNTLEKVGVLGGTFDPVHLGHLGIAHEALERFGLDLILFVPANISPHKRQRTVTPPHHRLEMIRRAIHKEPAFRASDMEITRAGVSYTIDTLESLATVYPELFLILGADAFKDIATWKEYRRLLENYNIIVATRPGYALDNLDTLVRDLSGGEHAILSPPEEESARSADKGKARYYQHHRTKKKLIVFEITPRPVSSSEIRCKIRDKKEIKNMLPPEVEQYIMKHQLYQAEPSPRI